MDMTVFSSWYVIQCGQLFNYFCTFYLATSASKAAETKTNDILAMISPEGERVGLTKVTYFCIVRQQNSRR